MTKKSKPKPEGIPIEWRDGDVKTTFANHLVVQADENEFYLSFYEIVPPLILERDKSSLKSVPANLVSRIVVSADRVEDFAKLILHTLAKHRRSDDNGKGGNDE